MESKKSGANELCKNRNRVTDLGNKLMVTRGKPGGGGRDKLGDWDGHIHTTIYKTDG